jgi:hypothetical protein
MAWEEVERQRRESSRGERGVRAGGGDGWRTVRVFVSSTFTDMHNEREVLVKKVSISWLKGYLPPEKL